MINHSSKKVTCYNNNVSLTQYKLSDIIIFKLNKSKLQHLIPRAGY